MRPDVSHIGLAVDTGDGGSCRRPPLGGRTRLVMVIVSAVMDVEAHTAKHEQQKCDHVYIHTPYRPTRAFFQMINLQSAGCGQARGVKPKAERRGGT